jgi:hypothetical protein
VLSFDHKVNKGATVNENSAKDEYEAAKAELGKLNNALALCANWAVKGLTKRVSDQKALVAKLAQSL